MKTNEGLVFFSLVDRNLAAATDPTENPYWTFGRRSYHHYLEVLAELFDVAEDPDD